MHACGHAEIVERQRKEQQRKKRRGDADNFESTFHYGQYVPAAEKFALSLCIC